MQVIEDSEFLAGVSFAGTVLGPLFLKRPDDPAAQPIVMALKDMPSFEDWPFGKDEELAYAYTLVSQGLEAPMEDLHDEYNRLFIGPAKKPAPPWGSVYLDRDCVVFGDSLVDLRRWMRKNSITTEYPEKEPEDQIGRMLLLMALCAENRPELLPEFMQEHLLTWSHHFFTELEAATPHSFYDGIAHLTDLTLVAIGEDLEVEVPQKKFYR